jgi:hypothetical protein
MNSISDLTSIQQNVNSNSIEVSNTHDEILAPSFALMTKLQELYPNRIIFNQLK